MNRRLAAGAAGTAGLVLLASACGTSTGYSKATSSIAPAGTSAAPELPPFRVGPLTQKFGTPLPASAARQAVLTDFRTAMLYWTKSGYEWRNVPGTTSRVVGAALRQLERAEQSLRAQSDVLGGTDEFFKTRITALTGSAAKLLTCDNSARDVIEDRATGKVNSALTVPASLDYIFETFRLVRHAGHWAISSLVTATLPQASARQCQPS
jgi:hypothetical protein